MSDEKVVVGWAIKRFNSKHDRWYWVDARGGGWDTKQSRHVFPTKNAAVLAAVNYMSSLCPQLAFNPATDSYKLVRITRKVKPKKYYVVLGPFDNEQRAALISSHSAHYSTQNWHVIESDKPL